MEIFHRATILSKNSVVTSFGVSNPTLFWESRMTLEAKYSPIYDQQEALQGSIVEDLQQTSNTSLSYRKTFYTFLAVVLAAVLGFLSGRYFNISRGSPGCQKVPVQGSAKLSYNVAQVFTDNKTFSSAPSPISNAAWDSLFPSE